jgi:hypothetical protein
MSFWNKPDDDEPTQTERKAKMKAILCDSYDKRTKTHKFMVANITNYV